MAANGARLRSLSFRSLVGLTIICSAGLSHAGNFTVYGPQNYVRQSGAPIVVTNTFAVANPNTQFTLHVVNGGLVDGESDFVSSTVITLNGVEVVAPNELNQNMPRLDKPVQLTASNTISVEVRGKPGGALSIAITGIDNDAPIISLAVDPVANTFGWNNTDVLVTFACTDPLSGIAFCPTAANVTAQGANQTVSGTATDRAGNSASAAVIINIDKTAPAISAALTPASNAAGWNNTDTAVSFNCTDALSGIAACTAPASVQTEGANQNVSGSAIDKAGNSASATASLNLDKTPPSLTVAASPAPNASGWNRTDVTVSFACSDVLSGVASCPTGATLSSEGNDQVVDGSAVDVAGNSSSAALTVRIDKTPPQIVISSPANGATVSSGNLTVNGTASDTLSGLASVTCNGATAAVSGADFQCGLSLVSGSNAIVVQATDVAGNVALNTLTVTFGAVLDPPPTAVFVTPSKFAMLQSETRKLALVDELGRSIPASSWTVSDPALAMVAIDGTVTPLAAGEVIVTGTFESLSAQAQLFVTPGQAFEVGTVRWLVEPLPGNSIAKIFPGQAGAETTSFMVETGSSGDVIRAFNQEGIQQWMYRISATFGLPAAATPASGAATKTGSTAAAASAAAASTGFPPGSSVTTEVMAVAVTDQGGTIMNQRETAHLPGGGLPLEQNEIIALDDKGRELWRRTAAQAEQWFAVHPDGTVFIVEPVSDDLFIAKTWQVTAVDGMTGGAKFSIPLPSFMGVGGRAPWVGPAIIASDWNFYLPFALMDLSGREALNVLRVTPQGSAAFTEIAVAPSCGLPLMDPRDIVPLNETELLVLWRPTSIARSCLGSTQPGQIVRLSVNNGAVSPAGTYPLPPLMGFQVKSPMTQKGDMVVGEDGVVFATDGVTVVAFDSATGNLRWTYQPPAFCPNCFHGFEVDQALEGNHLVLNDTERAFSRFGDMVTNLQVSLNSNGVPLNDPFDGYGAGSDTGIGALYPPSCYVAYLVTDPMSGLLTIILPDFNGPNCGQGFAAATSFASSSVLGPTPGFANVVGSGQAGFANPGDYDKNASRRNPNRPVLFDPVICKNPSGRPPTPPLKPERGLIGTKVEVALFGRNLQKVQSITVGPGINVTINKKRTLSKVIEATFDIAGNAPDGDQQHEIKFKVNANVAPNKEIATKKKFYVQIPTRLVGAAFSNPNDPNFDVIGPDGLGPPHFPTNDTITLPNDTVIRNACGVYKWASYQLLDQDTPEHHDIEASVEVRESFSNCTSEGVAVACPTQRNNSTNTDGMLLDFLGILGTAPNCPVPGDNSIFTQSFTVVIGDKLFPLTTTFQIKFGNFGGNLIVERTQVSE